MSTMLANLRTQWDETQAQMSAITEKAGAENRDLNDVERANFDALKVQLDGLKPRIEQLVEVERSFDSTAELFSSVSHSGRTELMRSEAPSIANKYDSPGEYLYDVFRAFGPNPDMEARTKLQAHSLIRRDATTTINGATIQNMTLAEVAAAVPDPIIGEIWSNVDARRPIANSLVLRAITGPVMFRPKVTQHTQIGPQGTGTPAGAAGTGQLGKDASGAVATNDEKASFASRKMTLGRVNVEPIAVGGVVDVSLWAEMLSPGLLDTIISDLAEQYAIETESLAAAEVSRAGTANPIAGPLDLAGATAAKDLQKAIMDAAIAVYNGTGRLPTHVGMSVDVWGMLGSLVDGSNRPLIPAIGGSAQNVDSSGGSAASFLGSQKGLTQLVSPGLPTKSLVVYSAQDIESFERRLGVLQAIEPERAGRVVSYSGLFQAVAMDDTAASKIVLA